jgi:hypothetical protein
MQARVAWPFYLIQGARTLGALLSTRPVSVCGKEVIRFELGIIGQDLPLRSPD